MKTISHNVAALDQVLGLATPVFDSYKPGNALIGRTALAALLEESRKSITAVHKAKSDLVLAINARQSAYHELPSIGSHVYHLAECNGMEDKDLQDLSTLLKRFRSQPFKSDKTQGADASESATQRKNRQLSYAQKLSSLESVITLLEGCPCYPVEAEWSVSALRAKHAELQQHNFKVSEARGALTRQLTTANKLIFDKKKGIVGVGRMTKRYVRLTLGRDAELYKSIRQVKFKTR